MVHGHAHRSRSARTTSSSSSGTCSSATTSGTTASRASTTSSRGSRSGSTHSFSTTSDPQQAGEVQGQSAWGSTPAISGACAALTLTYGMRVDIARFPDKPTANPVAGRQLRLRHRRRAEQHAVVAARRVQLGLERRRARSRSAAASGCSPAARRTSGSRTSTATPGIDFTRIGATFNATNSIPFVPDPSTSRRRCQAPRRPSRTRSTSSIRTSSTRRSCAATSATTASCRAASYGTVEFLWSNDVHDIKYQNLNLQQTGTLHRRTAGLRTQRRADAERRRSC